MMDRLLSRLLRPVVARLDSQAARLAKLEGRQAEAIDELRSAVDALTARFDAQQGTAGDLRRDLSALASRIDDVRHGLGRRGLGGQARRISADVRALLRRELLDLDGLPFPQRLYTRRANVSSQNEEDGLLLALLAEAGIRTGRFLDIGSGVEGGVASMLARELGWHGLMIDGAPAHVALARPRFGRDRLAVVQAFVTRENVNDLVREHGLTGEVDVFSLDIDGNDYWIWEALDACTPRIVAVEYNAFFGLERAVTVPYAASFARADLPPRVRKNFFGASLPAFVSLGRRRGYRLVTTDASGLNAFFLRHDVAPHVPECAIGDLPYRETDLGKYPDLTAEAAEAGLTLVDVG